MDQKNESSLALQNFVQTHKLRNIHSVIQFEAIINITTAIDRITNKKMGVMVLFDGYDNYGRINLIENELDPNDFPTVFEAKWQKIVHVDKEYLLISGIHAQNPKIGKYEIKITPLENTENE